MTQIFETPVEEEVDTDDYIHHLSHSDCQLGKEPVLCYCGALRYRLQNRCEGRVFDIFNPPPKRCNNGHEYCKECRELWAKRICYYC